jgi:hypothetical protein
MEQAWNFPVTVAPNAHSLIEIDQLRCETLSLCFPDRGSGAQQECIAFPDNNRPALSTLVFELDLRTWWNQPIFR